MRRSPGFTLLEVMVALAVIAVAFTALLFTQLGNLRTSDSARLLTRVKAAASRVLEERAADVLARRRDAGGALQVNGRGEALFRFSDYYYGCAGVGSTSNAVSSAAAPPRPSTFTVDAGIACGGTVTSDGVSNTWRVRHESGVGGEGQLLLTVEGRREGTRVGLVQRIACYDVYPSPISSRPAPCPFPGDASGAIAAGSGYDPLYDGARR